MNNEKNDRTSLEALAAHISDSSKIISKFCTDSGHPTPSNDSCAGSVLPADAPEFVQRARHSLLEAAQEIQQLCSEPSEYLEQNQIHYQQLACLHWLVHFDIFRHVPLTSFVPFTVVAASANVPLGRLKSVARMAMTSGLLCEPVPDNCAHSRISAQFVRNPAFLDWASFMTHYSAPTAARFTEATERWGDTAEKDQTAYNVAFDTPLPFFVHVAQSQERTSAFAAYMRSMNQSEGTALRHVLSGFDWASLGKAHVVDVGGSTGQVSILLAFHYPQLEFTVQDLPDTVAGAESIISTLEPSIASRITFTAHDFTTPQPAAVAASADVYLLRKIIHDWPFAEARVILQHLAASLKPGAFLLLMDTILPAPGSAPARQEAMLRVRDLVMAQSFNSKEREMSDWVELFESTVPKLCLKELKQPPGSVMAMMVAVRDDED